MPDNKPRIVAIIPARGGSKGIPRKNIKPLGGKPLIAWSIEDALQSRYISEVHVSTDDPDIAEVARRYGASAIMRPAALSTDSSSSEDALRHAIDSLDQDGAPVDIVVFLQATSPLRTSLHVNEALERFLGTGADSLLSVCPTHVFLWKEQGQWGIPVNYDYHHRPMRQQMQQFHENGSIYVFTPKLLRETGCRLGGNIALYHMAESCNIDIDTEADWAAAEIIMAKEART